VTLPVPARIGATPPRLRIGREIAVEKIHPTAGRRRPRSAPRGLRSTAPATAVAAVAGIEGHARGQRAGKVCWKPAHRPGVSGQGRPGSFWEGARRQSNLVSDTSPSQLRARSPSAATRASPRQEGTGGEYPELVLRLRTGDGFCKGVKFIGIRVEIVNGLMNNLKRLLGQPSISLARWNPDQTLRKYILSSTT